MTLTPDPIRDLPDAAPDGGGEGIDMRLSTVSTESQSYLRLVWRRLRKSVPGMLGLILVGALLTVAVFAPFFAPVDPKAPNVGFAPPDKISWYVPGDGPEAGWRLLPVVFPIVESDALDPVTFQPMTGPDYENPRRIVIWAKGWEYKLFGIPMSRHFLQVEDGSPLHILGTDRLGRDILSRGIVGSRISLALALTCITLITIIGTLAGITSGYIGGRFDMWFQRFVEIILAFPQLPLYLALASLIPVTAPSALFMAFVVLVIVGLGWAQLSREVRSKTLALRQVDYVRAAMAVGASDSGSSPATSCPT
jgi:peptide/nickel transport system permease protein